MVVFDESHHPIIVVRWTGELTVDDAERFFSHCDELLQQARARGQQLALINVSDIDKASPEVRRLLADKAKMFGSDIPSWVVLNNLIVRGVFTAIQWMEPSTKRNRVVGTFEQALREAKETLKIPA
jgi:hypothetical protein